MKCSYCGAEIPDDAQLCPECGGELTVEEVSFEEIPDEGGITDRRSQFESDDEETEGSAAAAVIEEIPFEDSPADAVSDDFESKTRSKPAAARAPVNMTCVFGLIVSLVSVVINIWGLVGLAGLVVSIIGLRQSRERHEGGRMPAMIGIVLGALSVAYGIYCIIIYL